MAAAEDIAISTPSETEAQFHEARRVLEHLKARVARLEEELAAAASVAPASSDQASEGCVECRKAGVGTTLTDLQALHTQAIAECDGAARRVHATSAALADTIPCDQDASTSGIGCLAGGGKDGPHGSTIPSARQAGGQDIAEAKIEEAVWEVPQSAPARWTALKEAVKRGQADVVRALLAHGGIGAPRGPKGLVQLAIAGGHRKVCLLLAEEGFPFESNRVRAVLAAARSGYLAQLQELDLAGFEIGEEGAIALAEAIKGGKLSRLRVLNLTLNFICERGCMAVADAMESGNLSHLQFLGMGQSNIGRVGSGAVARAIASGKCPNLRYLSFCYTDLGRNVAAVIATAIGDGRLLQLRELYMSETGIGDDGTVALASALGSGNCPELRVLELGRNDIGDPGAVALAAAFGSGNCPELRKLVLHCNGIGDTGALALAGAIGDGALPNLWDLPLQHNDIGERGTMALAEARGRGASNRG